MLLACEAVAQSDAHSETHSQICVVEYREAMTNDDQLHDNTSDSAGEKMPEQDIATPTSIDQPGFSIDMSPDDVLTKLFGEPKR